MYLPCIYQVFSRKSCSWCRNRWTNTWSWWSWSIWVPPRSRHSSGCCRRSRSRWGEGWRGRQRWGRPWWRRSHWECPWHHIASCALLWVWIFVYTAFALIGIGRELHSDEIFLEWCYYVSSLICGFHARKESTIIGALMP